MRALKGCVVAVFVLCCAIWYYFQLEFQKVQDEKIRDIEAQTENGPVRVPSQASGGTLSSDKLPGGKFNIHVNTKNGNKSKYKIVPPLVDGTMEQMWSGFKDGEQIFLPTFGLESLDEALKKKGIGNVTVSDLKPKYLYVEQVQNNKPLLYLVCYTDSGLIKEGAPFMTITPENMLIQGLYDPNCNGIMFNPQSRVCDVIGHGRGMNKYGLAEIIGYLRAKPDSGLHPYHVLANDAMIKKEWYKVLYYWAMSRREGREGDDWKKAELAKIRAWIELDFPRAREYARGELVWFMNTYGETGDGKALLERLDKMAEADKAKAENKTR